MIADEGEHEHHGHHGGRNYGAVERDYYYERASRYAPPPPSQRYNSYDQRSHQGLAGGVIVAFWATSWVQVVQLLRVLVPLSAHIWVTGWPDKATG